MPHIPPKEHKKKIRGIDIFNGRVNCWNCLQPFVISIMPIVNGLKMVTAGKRAVAHFCNYSNTNYVSASLVIVSKPSIILSSSIWKVSFI